MGDRTRLFLTGLAAVVVIGATVAGHGLGSMLRHSSVVQAQLPLSQLKNFDGITLRGPDDVIVTAGDRFAVTIDGDATARRYVSVYVDDGVLRVERRAHEGWWGPSGGATVHVTMPHLKRVWLAGTGNLEIDKADGREFSALLQGPGNMDVKDVTADTVRVTVQGPGDATLGGATKMLTLNLSGPGNVRADALSARTADITVSGPGDVQARAIGDAKLIASGPGGIHVTGTTKCQIDRTGPGEADCKP